jgi:hypothetical protein
MVVNFSQTYLYWPLYINFAKALEGQNMYFLAKNVVYVFVMSGKEKQNRQSMDKNHEKQKKENPIVKRIGEEEGECLSHTPKQCRFDAFLSSFVLKH